jgi:hypothetical protein
MVLFGGKNDFLDKEFNDIFIFNLEKNVWSQAIIQQDLIFESRSFFGSDV